MLAVSASDSVVAMASMAMGGKLAEIGGVVLGKNVRDSKRQGFGPIFFGPRSCDKLDCYVSRMSQEWT